MTIAFSFVFNVNVFCVFVKLDILNNIYHLKLPFYCLLMTRFVLNSVKVPTFKNSCCHVNFPSVRIQ